MKKLFRASPKEQAEREGLKRNDEMLLTEYEEFGE